MAWPWPGRAGGSDPEHIQACFWCACARECACCACASICRAFVLPCCTMRLAVHLAACGIKACLVTLFLFHHPEKLTAGQYICCCCCQQHMTPCIPPYPLLSCGGCLDPCWHCSRAHCGRAFHAGTRQADMRAVRMLRSDVLWSNLLH